jgi:hypothetical protein
MRAVQCTQGQTYRYSDRQKEKRKEEKKKKKGSHVHATRGQRIWQIQLTILQKQRKEKHTKAPLGKTIGNIKLCCQNIDLP